MTPEEIAQLPYRPCVGVVLRNAPGDVFVGQRIDSPAGVAAWQMPQGGIDPGETHLDAALRELTEETGIHGTSVEILAETREWLPYELPHDLVPKLWKGRFRGQSQKWVLMNFLGVDTEVDLTAHEQEFETWKWLPPDEVLEQIVPFKRQVYERVLTEFAPHL